MRWLLVAMLMVGCTTTETITQTRTETDTVVVTTTHTVTATPTPTISFRDQQACDYLREASTKPVNGSTWNNLILDAYMASKDKQLESAISDLYWEIRNLRADLQMNAVLARCSRMGAS